MATPPALVPAAQEPLDYTWVVVVLAFFAVLLVGVITMAVLAERSRRRAAQSGGQGPKRPGGQGPKRPGVQGPKRPGGQGPKRPGGESSQDGAG